MVEKKTVIESPKNKNVKIKSEEKPIGNKPTDKLDFQITDWNAYHEIDNMDEEKYVVQLFGRTEDDKDVCLKVMGFTTFF